jgi:signal transduction histidine kinase
LTRNAYLAHIDPDDRTALQQAYQAALAGTAIDIEYRITVDGDVRWIRSKGEVKFTDDGSPDKVIGIAQEITDRKRTEASLIAAKAEAEKANHAKSSFLTAVSHDLGQPIYALSLMVDVLEHSNAAVPKKLLYNMRECIKGISGLLTDLLDVSRLDAGVIRPSASDWSVDELLTATVAVHAVEAQAKGVYLYMRPTDVWTTADRRLVQRMVGNLISNAIRYTEKGGVLVACRRHSGKRWIEVWDTGIGIEHDKQSLVFEEFAQLNCAEQLVGSGLGLAIVAKIARLLGLRVRLRSTVGRGTMFAVELPPWRSGTPRHEY